MVVDDYYKILQIDSLAESEEIQAAYIRLMLKYAPDSNHSSDAKEKVQKIIEAFETLNDHNKRRDYDEARLRQTNNHGHSQQPSRSPNTDSKNEYERHDKPSENTSGHRSERLSSLNGFFRFFFSPKGRISRKEYVLGLILIQIIFYVPLLLLITIFPKLATWVISTMWEKIFILLLFLSLYVLPSAMLTIKRFHDLGMSGWTIIIGWLYCFSLLFNQGDQFYNKYGKKPQ